MIPIIKICGLKSLEAVHAAKDADYLGFIFYTPSPRNITPQEAAKLKAHANGETVAVTVNADETLLENIFTHFRPDLLQLHGSETPARIREIKKKFHVPVIKALNVATGEDLKAGRGYEEVTDFLLFDTKTPDGAHGGTGKSFDWKILAGKKFKRPYFLSGGININNAETALRASGALMLDVSSGLEKSPGNKDPQMVTEFLWKIRNFSL